jgi:DNA gyrase subunit B
MDPDELAQCLLNPETRYIEQITVADIKQADTLLEILMGTSVPPRKEYILQHSEEANDVY